MNNTNANADTNTPVSSSQQKIALITGGSRGLGKNTALVLARQGVDIILTYQSREADAHAVVAQIQALGRRAVALQLDTGAADTFAGFTEKLQQVLAQQWQRHQFDFLMNNAGIGGHTSFAETSETQFDQLMNIHFKGVFFLTQTLLPVIADHGRILNVSSGLTRFSLPGHAAYAAMKGAVEVLSRYLAKELDARGIAVNVIAPGAIATDFGGGVVRDNAQLNQFIANQTALGRAGLPDDIGGVASALLSDSCGWINGQRIEASGGMFL
ncbi:SDR family oxidoreductase [Undibacterium sp. FT79W]|uniref:SDR family NAD(P)-dependent oxidoreductase n=1 Tax=Undibacterium sp. FT79W TaxID=2762296 RepID=UPI00164ACA01|nr:SDR family oxidoreductase [Undibacterium sp. FT79W]MBC3878866.1 SDR family oxidoreductase [Undibacterium sp. FT79W]